MSSAAESAAKLPALARLARAWPRAAVEGLRLAAEFDGVSAYCMFIGYQRSGHSLVGALLDAHPDMVIAHELDALQYVQARFSRNQLYALLVAQARAFEARGQRGGRYSYRVENSWQGRFRQLRIIGDKKGASSSLRLHAAPHLLDRLRRLCAVPLRVVHVFRHPLDNIVSMARLEGLDLAQACELYFKLAETNDRLRRRLAGDELFEIAHEEFVAAPEEALGRLCAFLGQPAPGDWVEACAAIVRPSPRRTRDLEAWPPGLAASVLRRASGYPFLARSLAAD
jgi:hypothetical protein